MRRYGLLGKRLGHSHSPAIHAMLAPYNYELFELPPEAIEGFIRQPDIGGLNVTIPYKQLVMPLCDALSPQAQRIGSVNTLVYGADGRITGHNTDYEGMLAMADKAGIALAGRKVVILGSGGTAQTAIQVAKDQGAREIIVISRSGESHYGTLDRHHDAEILMNTTPVGMYPRGNESPISLEGFGCLEGVLDVIYNPLRTKLTQDAAARGIPSANGMAMLVYQAARAASLFLDAPISKEATEEALRGIHAAVENLVLIGMPGCGKSSMGRALATLTGRPLVDTDAEIIKRAGKPIPEIFAEEGEAAFRALEREVIAEVAGRSGLIIATGGGSVMAEENRAALKRNGRVVYLARPLAWLAVKGRPLSTDIESLARQRIPIYQAFCDIEMENRGNRMAVAGRIWEAFLQ